MGAPIFVLNVRTSLSSQEEEYIYKYRLSSMIVYEKESVTNAITDSGLFKKIFVSLAARSTGRMFTVSDLVHGRSIECRDIVEMLEAEGQIKEAAEAFYAILTACQQFGGEEVIAYPREG